jgi:hypothetical protein
VGRGASLAVLPAASVVVSAHQAAAWSEAHPAELVVDSDAG